MSDATATEPVRSESLERAVLLADSRRFSASFPWRKDPQRSMFVRYHCELQLSESDTVAVMLERDSMWMSPAAAPKKTRKVRGDDNFTKRPWKVEIDGETLSRHAELDVAVKAAERAMIAAARELAAGLRSELDQVETTVSGLSVSGTSRADAERAKLALAASEQRAETARALAADPDNLELQADLAKLLS